MVLSECSESFFRLIFVVLKFFALNWGWTITLLLGGAILSVILQKLWAFATIIVGIIADAVDYIGDILIETAVPQVISSIVTGILWGVLILVSPANTILKIFALPGFLIIGLVVGAVPDFLPVTIVLGVLMKSRLVSNIFAGFLAFLPILFFITGISIIGTISSIFLYFFGQDLCVWLNSMIMLFA